MAHERASLTAILGPTNTGKTHLAVERMCGHASGMMGFPLRLLAREIYDRVVKIKGVALVALITGEEKIEPPNARYYCCTAESMMMDREFAFVAIDEAQLGADPERGHIFTDRMLHARGYSETMILGSESLRPLIRKLLPEAEIITRPRFSTLSYAGAKKLSRLPKRSAVVAFSVEQVYAVAESLRRLRGGCAVVMGALSPRTRNAQVDMFQAGEVDFLVATDAIGMGLNLDVAHVAFAGLAKFDGSRRRRLTVAEMAQIAGRAGRHQKNGTFGTLAGEAGEMSADEILAIEDHRFPALDWLYWREAEPRCENVEVLIADLESKPTEPGLRAAPEAIDLDVLKRLTEMPEVMALVRRPVLVKRLWEAACLPDFRQLGAEPHSRFVANLWQYLGSGYGHLPHNYVAAEIARLDSTQGDVSTISQRIAAVRTWTYIAHRPDWLADPVAMASLAKGIEEKLSDALHAALRQRFVDRRATTLMRSAGMDAALLPVEVDANSRVLVDGEDIGRLDGFAFRVDAGANAGERKLLLAAAERHLAVLLKQKAKEVKMADDSEFALGADAEGRPAIFYKGEILGRLEKGRTLVAPLFKPVRAVGELEGDALRDITSRAEAWIAAQLEKHLGGIIALQSLSQNADVDGNVRALAVQLAEEGGIAGRAYLADAMAALPKEARGAARKGGIVFGALDVYHHSALKPAAAKWRAALFAARDGRALQILPPESAVHLKEWKFASIADCRNAGYRRIGDEYLRIDLAERIVKKAHEARGQAMTFGMDMAFVTSLGVSEAGLMALMRDAGFKPAAATKVAVSESECAAVEATEPTSEVTPATADSLQTEMSPPVPEIDPAAEHAAPTIAPAAVSTADTVKLSYWRWVGIRNANPAAPGNRANQGTLRPGEREGKRHNKKPKPLRKPSRDDVSKSKAEVSPPSSLALQLAALQSLRLPGTK
jgi:ATP-dependent RNA helicase SUPV3L1/SUV3